MFKLSRYFSITSLVGIAIVVAVLSYFYRHVAFDALMEHENRSNAALTRTMANSVWPQYSEFASRSATLDREALMTSPENQWLRSVIVQTMHGLPVAKVKIYALNGRTLFSTDPNQIGEDKSGNAAFKAAKSGAAVSNITFRDRFDSFEGTLVDRNLVYSYVPIRRDDLAPVEGVAEVYSDVTELMHQLARTQLMIVGGVLTSLTLLYLFLFLIVRRADSIIRMQERERLQSEDRIRHQAYHDALTGLPNRAAFTERLDEAIKSARCSGRQFALVYMDLNKFKAVNDTYGHTAGDQLLRVAAKRFRASLREGDTLFRLGGDEFTALLEDLSDADEAAAIAARLVASAKEPVKIMDRSLPFGTSLGLALFPTDAQDAAHLIKAADTAMYAAKGLGSSQYQFAVAPEGALNELTDEQALRTAVAEGQFVLHYQPRLASDEETVVAVEALARWEHPREGLIPPCGFIMAMERNGLILPFGEWVLRTACAQGAAWRATGHPEVRIAVNVSPRQFVNGDLADTVQAVLTDTALPAHLLELELTETAIFDDLDAAEATLAKLRRIGVKVSIDDFGSGYNSMLYLKRFAVDFIKIDRVFVGPMATSPADRAIVNAIAELGRQLGIGVVAEGVEDDAQLALLRRTGCTELQGYRFSRPAPAGQLAASLWPATMGPGATWVDRSLEEATPKPAKKVTEVASS